MRKTKTNLGMSITVIDGGAKVINHHSVNPETIINETYAILCEKYGMKRDKRCVLKSKKK